jgi:hypothetical protein
MSPEKELATLLQRHKFVLVSAKNHKKYQNSEGQIFITAQTPSDWRSWRNAIAALKRVIAVPAPSSQVIEEERQRKELEKSIQLSAQVPPPAGISGAGKKAKSKGCGITYIEKVVPALTTEQIEQSKRAAERSKAIHEANRRVRRLRERFIQFAQDEGRVWIEQHLRADCERMYAEAVAECSHKRCQTGEQRFDRNIADAIAKFLPEFLVGAKLVASLFKYELTDIGFQGRIPVMRKFRYCPDDAFSIWHVYRKWMKQISTPEDWIAFDSWTTEVLAKEPDEIGDDPFLGISVRI